MKIFQRNTGLGIIAGLLVMWPALVGAQAQELVRENVVLEAGLRTPTRVQFQVESPGLLLFDAGSIDLQPILSLEGPGGFSAQAEESQGRSQGLVYAPQGDYRLLIESADRQGSPPREVQVRVTLLQPENRLGMGEGVEGRLTPDSFMLPGSNRSEWYLVEIPETGTAVISMHSSDVDTLLTVYYPDGRIDSNDDYGSGTDSRITLRGEPGVSVLLGASALFGEEGAYSLDARIPEPPPALRLGELLRGQVFSSGSGDELRYEFTAPKSGYYRFSLSSSDFDTLLEASLAGGTRLSDDDGGEGSNSMLTVPLDEGENAEIIVKSYSGSGSFELVTALIPDPPALELGTAVSGELSPGGINRYSFRGRAGQLVSVQLVSQDFDTLLFVTTPEGTSIENDDASQPRGGSSAWDYVSRVEYQFTGDAPLFIEVRGYSQEDSGAYELLVTELDSDSIVPYREGARLELGEPVTSFLSAMGIEASSDDWYGESRVGQVYTIGLTEGRAYQITLESDSFDTFLQIDGPQGEAWENDDGPEDTNSLLVLTAPASGQYRLTASSYSGDAQGIYTLKVEEFELGELVLDQRGAIGAAQVEQEYVLTVSQPGTVRINLQSQDFDTRLSLLDPRGIIMAEDDDGGSGTDSMIVHDLNEPGIYTIRVMSFSSDAAGEFHLQVYRKDL
ncbi:PPC domain-containing protein [Spirochaeta lutea]|uniref:Peptidase C-terminal archaeal/bacterial domain-containing protein n=1 Tax=Spirochaeta lutea TaxID=1480694 RepID=A0A098QW48_9SPIO|nr:PPC domain-containing protein [Spirochaeta lutea]KGE70727.1 hypothetical protein DC28_14585 [Spirochaeta lutea]